MEFKTPSAVFLVAMACTGLAFILQLVGLATPGWLVSDGDGLGLWQICREGVCMDIGEIRPNSVVVSDWFTTVRALGIVSVLFLAGCLLSSVAACFFEHSFILLICAALAVTGGLCSLVEIATFAVKYADAVKQKGGPVFGYFFAVSYDVIVNQKRDPDLGYSFALTVVAGLLAMMACAVFMFAYLRKQNAN